MTAAHTAMIQQLMTLLDEMPDVALRIGRLDTGQLGHLHFPTRTITISENANTPQFVSALMHEIVHLMRGPSYDDPDAIACDEAEVRERTARLLVPPSQLPPGSDPNHVAHHYEVDINVARLSVELARLERAEGTA
jgi:hypothetical protein